MPEFPACAAKAYFVETMAMWLNHLCNKYLKAFLAAGLVVVLFASHCFGQTFRIEKLKTAIAQTKNDTERLHLLLSLCEEKNSLNADSLYRYATEAKTLSERLHINTGVLWADYYTAISVEKRGLLDSALKLANKHVGAIKAAPGLQDIRRRFLYLKGTALLRNNDYENALAVFFDVLNKAEYSNDIYNQIAARGAIGWDFMEMNRPQDALEWFYKTLATTNDPAYERYLIPTYINLSAVYGQLERYDSVEHYVNLAISNARKYETLTFLCNALNIKGELYTYLKKNDLAEASLTEALAIRRQIGDPFYLAADLSQLSSYFTQQNKPDKAITSAKEGIDTALRYHITSKLPILYLALAQAYNAKGDLQNYSATITKYIAWEDSLYQTSTSEAVAELETKYNVQKKENTIIKQQLELVKRSYMLAGSIVLIFLIFITGLLLFRGYRKREKLKLDQMIEKEKLMSLRAIKDAEENERRRIAADLHDNLGAYAASITYNLESFTRDSAKKGDRLKELRTNAEAMVAELSDTIWALKPETLRLTAISDRMKVFIQKIDKTYPHINIEVREEIEKDILLPPSHGFHLLRILQEAVNNAVKHSACSEVIVSLRSRETWDICVADNGVWLKPGGQTEGNGIFNMKKRAEMCGWDIEWNAQKEGTEVCISSTTF